MTIFEFMTIGYGLMFFFVFGYEILDARYLIKELRENENQLSICVLQLQKRVETLEEKDE